MDIAEIADADIEGVVALWERCGLTRPWNDPLTDIASARASPSSALLVSRSPVGQVTATVMVGFDGHRGWIYYLAVDPDARLRGCGRRMMAAAEDWLRAHRAPKIQLMVREENAAVTRLLRAGSAMEVSEHRPCSASGWNREKVTPPSISLTHRF